MSGNRPLACVTGGRRGIGAAIALELARQGFDIALTDIDSGIESIGSEDPVAAVRAAGGRAQLFDSDLGRIEDHADLVHRVADWGGPIACLINNAGIGSPRRGDLLDLPPDAYDRVLDVNLRGTFFLTQAVARHMVAVIGATAGATAGTTAGATAGATAAPAAVPVAAPTSGAAVRSIVTVSSVSAEMASIERGEYCVSKAGLGMLTRLFALRLAPLGIGVFEVRPGVIRTPMTAAVSSTYDQRIADGLVPMGRWGTPHDVARAVAALVSGRFAFASGSVVNVDGALSIPRL